MITYLTPEDLELIPESVKIELALVWYGRKCWLADAISYHNDCAIDREIDFLLDGTSIVPRKNAEGHITYNGLYDLVLAAQEQGVEL